MPSHFDRFRLLNGGSRLRNESDKVVYAKAEEPDEPIGISPGTELDLPFSPSGECILELEFPLEEPNR
jgi:hypothetical protein